eukprot:TRINITY_DN10596_c0_g1_i1.p1 TRINITY_DN10596_c0_g1~~TRINITY_DN10596_c0_g1_i1.p1  ORF type:complete len:545 (-),score=103.49 TRINITY_DN10596_c0_g1_i1:111-1691(-)
MKRTCPRCAKYVVAAVILIFAAAVTLLVVLWNAQARTRRVELAPPALTLDDRLDEHVIVDFVLTHSCDVLRSIPNSLCQSEFNRSCFPVLNGTLKEKVAKEEIGFVQSTLVVDCHQNETAQSARISKHQPESEQLSSCLARAEDILSPKKILAAMMACYCLFAWAGDRYCDASCNTPAFGYDGGDCCPSTCPRGTGGVFPCGVIGYDCRDCNANLCQNDGTCQTLVNSGLPYCECRRGWTGPTCSDVEDPCDPNPCRNNGRCFSSRGEFLCDCQDGWKGFLCDEPTFDKQSALEIHYPFQHNMLTFDNSSNGNTGTVVGQVHSGQGFYLGSAHFLRSPACCIVSNFATNHMRSPGVSIPDDFTIIFNVLKTTTVTKNYMVPVGNNGCSYNGGQRFSICVDGPGLPGHSNSHHNAGYVYASVEGSDGPIGQCPLNHVYTGNRYSHPHLMGANVWHQVALMRHRNILSLHVNGVRLSCTAQYAGIFNPSGINIGNACNNNDYPEPAIYVSDFRLYSRAVDPAAFFAAQ